MGVIDDEEPGSPANLPGCVAWRGAVLPLQGSGSVVITDRRLSTGSCLHFLVDADLRMRSGTTTKMGRTDVVHHALRVIHTVARGRAPVRE